MGSEGGLTLSMPTQAPPKEQQLFLSKPVSSISRVGAAAGATSSASMIDVDGSQFLAKQLAA